MQRVGQTEMISDSLNPKWVKPIKVDYFFEMQQSFVLKIYDVDDESNLNNLGQQDFIGEYQFQLSKVVGSRESAIDIVLNKVPNGKQGKTMVHIHAEEQKSDHGQIALSFKPSIQMAG